LSFDWWSCDAAVLSLSVTVAVGCALLTLNVAVFVLVYRQKRRARLKLGAAARFRSRDGGGGAETESACFDSQRSSVSSYSLAASSLGHPHQPHSGGGAVDCGRCASRNVRFCEARGAPAAVTSSQDGGFATRRLPPRPGRDGDAPDGGPDSIDAATTNIASSNHLNNPSTTV